MGEELIGKLIMTDENGNETEINNVIVSQLEAEPNIIENDDIFTDYCKTSAENYTYSANIKIKSITRKKCIKMLMAKGIAKNGAKDIADYIFKKYRNYNPMNLWFI